jgi:hypothetical protein
LLLYAKGPYELIALVTCTRGSAKECVENGYRSQWKTPIFGEAKTKATNQIVTKFGTVDYIGKMKSWVKIGMIGQRVCPHIGEI